MPDPSTTATNPSPFDKDAAYLNQTLRHERMELALDDSVSLQAIGFIIVRAWLASIIPAALFGIIGLVLLFQEAGSSGDVGEFGEGGGGGGLGGAAWMLGLAFFGGGATFWLVLLLSKVTEPIGEWRVLLADRWQYAESYHRMISAALYQRAIPIALQHRRVRLNAQGQPIKHTVVLAEGDYQAYVTVFPYGTSLYVGWQMWRRRNGAQLISRALVDRFTAANVVTAMLRTDRPRAMREAVHLACREAVYMAVTPERWDLAQKVDLGELVEESALLLPHQVRSPVLPPAGAPAPGPSFRPAGPAAPAGTVAPAPMPQPNQPGQPTQPVLPIQPNQPVQPVQPDAPLDESQS
jgi:hypothetical protein